MMVLRPKPSGDHRTIGLTVAPLRVLSRFRRLLAQKLENDHDAACFWGCQGKGVRSHGLGALDHFGGSKGAPAVGGFAAFGSWPRIQRTLGARSYLGGGRQEQVSQGDCWQVGATSQRRLAFPRSMTSAPLSLSGTRSRDHSSKMVAVALTARGSQTHAGRALLETSVTYSTPHLQAPRNVSRRHFGTRSSRASCKTVGGPCSQALGGGRFRRSTYRPPRADLQGSYPTAT